MNSPSSSGPAGSLFEAQVGAHYLLSLLVGAQPRGLPDTTIERVQFQGAADGRALDDIVVHAHDFHGKRATLEIQVKRGIRFTPSDREFYKVVAQIAEASGRAGFFDERYELAIATSRHSYKVDGAYQDILTWARDSSSAELFMAKVRRPGSANDDMRHFIDTFRANLKKAEAKDDDEYVWRLLTRLQILTFDYTAQGSAWEAWERERTARALKDPQRAGALRDNLTELAIEVASSGGDRTRERLVEDVTRRSFRLAGNLEYAAARKALAEASRNALADILVDVGGVKLKREEQMNALRSALDKGGYVEIRGDAGVGKSGLLKHFAERLSAESDVIVLSPRRIISGGWTAMRAILGFDGTARELLVDLAGSGGGVLFLDGVDFFTEDERRTVVDLVRDAAKVPGFKVIATARREFGKEEPNWLPAQSLEDLGSVDSVVIEELSCGEIEELGKALPEIAPLLTENHPARPVARNLFRLARLIERPGVAESLRTEAEMARDWWDTADGRKDDSTYRDRARLLRKLARKALVRYEPMDVSHLPATAVDTLIRSQTLRDLGCDQVAFRHDVYRDWAIANVLFTEPRLLKELPSGLPAPASILRGFELAARMALEREEDNSRWESLLKEFSHDEVHGSWRQAVLLSPVHSEIGSDLLTRISNLLLSDNARLLCDLIRTVMVVDVRQASEIFATLVSDPTMIPEEWNLPSNLSWYRLVHWLLSYDEDLPILAIPRVVDLYVGWSRGSLGIDRFTPDILKRVYGWLSEIEAARNQPATSYNIKDLQRMRKLFRFPELFNGELEHEQVNRLESTLRDFFLCFCHRAPYLAARYLRSVPDHRDRHGSVSRIFKFSKPLAQAAPKELAELTMTVLMPDRPLDQRDTVRPWGLVGDEFMDPYPAPSLFLNILVSNPEIGRQLIRRVVDHSILFHFTNRPQDRDQIVVSLDGNTRVFPWLTSYEWSRDWGPGHPCVTAALIALEVWSHQRVESGEPVEKILSELFEATENPAAYLLLAVDILISHWPESRAAAEPFVGCPELLCLDYQRPERDCRSSDYVLISVLEEDLGVSTSILNSLKERPSRRASLVDLLRQYALVGPQESRDKITRLLGEAAEQLSPYEEQSDFSDPAFMVSHALNRLDSENWQKDSDPNLGDVYRYVSPPKEARHLKALREKFQDKVIEATLQVKILEALDDPSRSSIELAKAAAEWAQRAEMDFQDRDDGKWWPRQTIVAAALVVVRDGDPNLILRYGEWARSVFKKTLRDEAHFYLGVRPRIGSIPVAMVFAGFAYLLRRPMVLDEVKALLDLIVSFDDCVASAFNATSSHLAAIDERLLRAGLRLAFATCIRPAQRGVQTEEKRASQEEERLRQLRSTLDAELAWLGGEDIEPPWPRFPAPDSTPTNIPLEPLEALSRAIEYVDHYSAARWLKTVSGLFDVSSRPWLCGVVRHYSEWTALANASGWVPGSPLSHLMAWNEAYFGLLARCISDMDRDKIDKLVLTPIISLLDYPFYEVVTCVLRNVDAIYIDNGALEATQAVRLRTVFADRLTKCMGWRLLRQERSETIGGYALAGAIAAFFLHRYDPLAGSTHCSVSSANIDRLEPLGPILEQLTLGAPCLFVARLMLDLIELCPKAAYLHFILAATDSWLANQRDNALFWIDYNIGRRVCALIEAICERRPTIVAEDQLATARIHKILSELVAIGVPEAHRLERKLAADVDG